MIKFAICNDTIEELDQIQALISKYLSAHPQYDIELFVCSGPSALFAHMDTESDFDVFILAIHKEGMSGIEVARELRHRNDQGEIIFLTDSSEYALDAFEVMATQYLVMPFEEKEFFSALNQVMHHLVIDRREVLVLKTTRGYVRIAPRNIVYTTTSRNNYQYIYTIHGERIEIRITSRQLFHLLSGNKFLIRCGASLNVNMKFIHRINRSTILFDTGTEVAYPYSAYPKLKARLLINEV